MNRDEMRSCCGPQDGGRTPCARVVVTAGDISRTLDRKWPLPATFSPTRHERRRRDVNAIALGPRRGRVLALIAVALVLSTLALARPATTVAQDEELPKLTMWGWPTALLGFFDTEDDKLVDRIREELGIEL